jgi:hypothetical protein
MRLSLLIAVALSITPKLHADVISPEWPASALHWQQGTDGTIVRIAHGLTRSYEVVQDGGLIFGNDLLLNGQPDLSTRRVLAGARLIGLGAIGDDFYVAFDTADLATITVMHINDGKQVRLATEHLGANLTANGTRLLLIYSTQTSRVILFDRDLNQVVPPLPIPLGSTSVTPLVGQFFLATANVVVVAGTPATYSLMLIDDAGKLTTVTRPLPSGSLMGAGVEIYDVVYGGAHSEMAYLQRYSPQLVPVGDLMPIVQSSNTLNGADAVPFGNGYFVGWLVNGDLYAQRLGAGEPILVATGVRFGGLELGPGVVLARWKDAAGKRFVRRVDANDDPHPDVLLPAEERTPSISGEGVTSLVAWSDTDVRVARVATDGTALDGAGIVIAESPLHPAGPVQIVVEGDRYLVFWVSEQALFARYVERDGTPSGDVFRVSPQGQNVTHFDAAWTGAQYVLSWGFLFESTLATMAPGGVEAVPVGVYQSGAGVSGGPHPIVFGVRANSGRLAATFFDTGRIADVITLPAGVDARLFHAASSGHDYVVTWTALQSVGNLRYQSTVWAMHLDENGNPSGVPVVITSFDTGFPDTTRPGAFGVGIPLWDGKNYRILYAGATLGEATLGDDTFICRCFAHTDVAFDTASIKTFSAAIGAGGSVVAYDRPVTLPDGATVRDRVFMRFVRPVPERHRAAGH